jgi:glycosyltransferase involved in cell wall biosynthesis
LKFLRTYIQILNPKISVLLSLYRGENYLSQYLDNFLSQTWAEKCELVVIHNDPSPESIEIINSYACRVNLIYLPRVREGMYASINAGIKASTAPFITIWNVDDIRTPNSLELLASALEKSLIYGWSYGDFEISNVYGGGSFSYVTTPEWSYSVATSSCIGGPFFMFRRSLIGQVGLFDEQFLSGGDFDFTVRLSLVSNGIKVRGSLGSFLNERKGLSTSGDLQAIERTVIQRRYGIWKNFDLFYFYASDNYRCNEIKQGPSSWVNLYDFLPQAKELSESKKFKLLQSLIFTGREFLRRAVKRIYGGLTRSWLAH